MTKKKMTIEDLGYSVKSLTGVVEDLAIMTQKGLDEVRSDVSRLEDKVQDGFDRVENLLLRAHENRLEKLEDDLRTVKALLKVK